jgi:hypothetical protein
MARGPRFRADKSKTSGQEKGDKKMNIALTYQSGQQYSERLSHFDVKVSRGTKRVRISFTEKGSSWGHLSFSLPPDKAKQLAHAILTTCAGDVKPIEFTVGEAPINKAVAA